MSLRIASGSANRLLASMVADELGAGPVVGEIERFPDGELRPTVPEMRGADVFVVQSTGSPVNEHLVELMLLIDACRRAGADRVTAVVPYFGYARQDRRSQVGQAIGARVAAAALSSAGMDRLIVIDPHTVGLETMLTAPVEILTAVSVITGSLLPAVAPETVVVAPDLGAVKLAERYAAQLGLSVVIVKKTRMTGSTVRADELVGPVDGRPAIVVDDLISTGATIEAAVRLLLDNGARPGVAVVATHGVFVGQARQRLAELPVGRLIVTDSLETAGTMGQPLEVASIAPMLSAAIGGLHQGQPVGGLIGST